MSLSARLEVAPNPIFTGRRVEFHSLLDTGIDFEQIFFFDIKSCFCKKYNTSILSLSFNRYRVSYNKDTGVCKLEISMTFADDAGEYTIFAKNQHGEASATTSLLEEG